MSRWSILVASCSLTSLACSQAHTAVSTSAVTIAGDWSPPPQTMALSNPQFVSVVDPPRITGSCASTCPDNVWGGLCTDPGCSGLLPGIEELSRYIRGRWSQVGSGGDYACRRNSNPRACDSLSVHSVGRAVDLMITPIGGDADNTAGDPVANWLIENAEYIGVQRVIWDGKYWNGGRIDRHFSDIPDDICNGHYCIDHHVNHIHVELSVDGAHRRTRFFTAGAPPATCPVVCYGNAAVRADCTFVDCAAAGQVCVPDPPRCASTEAPAAARNAGAALPTATRLGGLTRFQPVAAARLFDTRAPESSTLLRRSDGASSGPLGPARTGTISAFPGVPGDATGVWMNVAAVPLTAPGFIAVYPAGSSTDTAAVNFAPPLPRANASAVARGAGGGVTFRASTDADLIVDMTGAFAPAGMGLRAAVPTRVYDSRATSPLAADARLAVTLPAPAGARGVVASVAVIPRGAPGFVRAFACDGAAPPTSNINHGATEVVNNTVITAISGAQLCFQSYAAVDLTVDVTGYLVDAGELSLQLVNPLRVMDTRSPTSIYTGRLGAGQIVEVPVLSIGGLPADARSALLNITTVEPGDDGFVTAFPCGSATPATSSLNYTRGQVRGAAVVSALGGGRLCLFSRARTHLVVDLLGVWVPTPGAPASESLAPPPEAVEEPVMPSADAGAPPPPDVVVPPADVTAPLADVTAPPADVTALPADATAPPADASEDVDADTTTTTSVSHACDVTITPRSRAHAALLALACAAGLRRRRARRALRG